VTGAVVDSVDVSGFEYEPRRNASLAATAVAA
jgi:hypothetical protein